MDEPIIRDNQDRTPSLRGTRLTVFNIMDHHLAGRSVVSISGFYDIPIGDAQAAMDYIDAHLGELMPAYQRDLERKCRGNPPHIEAMFAEKLMRLKEDLEHKESGETRDARAAG